VEVRGSQEGSSAALAAERGLLGVVLLVVGARLVQAAITIGLGREFYTDRWRVSGAFLLALFASVWIARSMWRQGHAGLPWLVALEAVALACLFLVATATRPEDLTTSFNWSLPFAQSAALVLAMAAPRQITLASIGTGFLCVSYLLSVAYGSDHQNLAALQSAGGNTVGILAMYVGGALVVAFVRRQAADIDQANKRTDTREIELSAARTREREFRRLHDDAVQVLERASAELEPRNADILRQAEHAAHGLRAALAGEQLDRSLVSALADLAQQRRKDGLNLTVSLPSSLPDVDSSAVEAIAAATNEAVTNVWKHAGTNEAAIVVRAFGNQVEVSVQDAGIGFIPAEISEGFGLAGSIRGPIEHAGGKVTIESARGIGTTVSIVVPLRPPDGLLPRPAAERIERRLIAVVLGSRAAYIVYAAGVIALNQSYYSGLSLVWIGLLLAAAMASGLGVLAWRLRRISLTIATLDALTSGLVLVLVTQSLSYHERVGSRNWALAYVIATVLWLAFGAKWPARLGLAALLGLTYYLTVVVGGQPTTVVEVTALSNAVSPPMFFGVYYAIYAMLAGLAGAADRVHNIELGQRREAAALSEREELFRRVHLPAIRALESISDAEISVPDGAIRKMARSTSRLVRQAIAGRPEEGGRAALRREIEALESSRVQVDVIDDLSEREPRAAQIDTLSHALALAIAEATNIVPLDPFKVRVVLSSIEDDLALTVRLPYSSDRNPLKQTEELLERAGGQLTHMASLQGEIRISMRVPW
jgi:signal transduction histidine kinase